jgi:hypothetical protein
MELSRRSVFRSVRAAGIVAAAGGVASVVLPGVAAASGVQDNWRWCRNCNGLFFGGHTTFGVCPAYDPGYVVQHNPTQSGNYTLFFYAAGDGPLYQHLWKWCEKCEGLWFSGNAGTNGVCPNIGPHSSNGSGDYELYFGPALSPVAYPGWQDNWRWCDQCQGLWFAGNPTSACPALRSTHGPHSTYGSGDYWLPQQ